ncbi:helix-turn-helix domain-containing protein [Flavobacterium sp. TAB 87]|uniref:helix-turn-helix domain-containing protein n=1 Tax=Flavobacterium sp. TAB 87 TaxID=1729581 RepID=UPI00076D2C9E|nr:helix-turn-helix domain-containing protein [Flavobacterium sp. TAB 87]KVV14612.1 Helix-turn-helix domain protein [Flavobacterium sp. TAB 87]
MNILLKNAREQKGLKTREVAQISKIDQALISKFESGTRKPTKDQIIKLSNLLEINTDDLLVLWLKDKILNEIKSEPLGLKALKLAEAELLTISVIQPKSNFALQIIFDEIAVLQDQFKKITPFDLRRITKQTELEFTFECNRINGNSLNFEETKLVINDGITIGGKPMQEHLEVINFYEAVQFCKDIVQRKIAFTEKELLQLKGIVSRGLQTDQTEKYVDKVVCQEMEVFFKWFESNKNLLSIIEFAVESHLKLMTILPFHNGNNQIALLVMNLILLQNQLNLTIIKGDSLNKEKYIAILEQSLLSNNNAQFTEYFAKQLKETLTYSLSLQNN